MVAVSFLNAGELVGGKYAITRVIGSGGMAIVYEALHVRLDQRVALKMLLPDLLDRDDIVTRFDREARAAVRLRSPHVARVFDVDALPDGTPYMVMELLDGRDLAAELTLRGPLPLADAVNYVLQACEAMAEAHRQGTVHRDLKPSNLFLTHEGGRDFVKVLDFGVSKIAAERLELSVTSTRSALGTALYMSPEQVRSAKNVDSRTDVWALGVVLYELLTGRAPFAGESTTAVAAAIVADEPEPLGNLRAGLPAELQSIVMRCLEKDREKRFADAGAFGAALAPFYGHEDGEVAVSAKRDISQEPPAERAAPPPTDNGRPSTAATMHSADDSADRVGAAIRADHALADPHPTPEGEPSALLHPVAGANDQSLRPVASAIRNGPPVAVFRAAIDRGAFAAAPVTPRANAVAEPFLTTTDAPQIPVRRVPTRGIALVACAVAFLGVGTVVVPKLAHRAFDNGANSESEPDSASAAVLVGILPSTPGAKVEPEAGIAATGASPEIPAPPSVEPTPAPRVVPAPINLRVENNAASRSSVSPRPVPNRVARPAMPATPAPAAMPAAAPLPAEAPRAPAPAPAKPAEKRKRTVDLPDTPG
jgi:serine/threonine-protein kinase